MPYVFNVDHKIIAATTFAATASLAVFSSFKWWQVQKTLKSRDHVYETAHYLNEYLLFHYSRPEEILPWKFGPVSALEFPKRCAELCIKYFTEKVTLLSFENMDVIPIY